MSESQDFQRWLNGEIRVDGFQSPWLKKTLADRAKQVPKASPVAKDKRKVA